MKIQPLNTGLLATLSTNDKFHLLLFIEKRLTEEEKKALLDYMCSLWPKEIQVKYDDRFK